MNTTAFDLRLGGRVGQKIFEDYKKVSVETSSPIMSNVSQGLSGAKIMIKLCKSAIDSIGTNLLLLMV